MKKTNYKFLLTALVIMSIFITLSTISATDNVSSDNAQLTTSDDITQLQSEQINTDIKKTNTENKDIQKEISTKKNNKINNTNNQKTTKKDTYSVNNYQELYNKVEDIYDITKKIQDILSIVKYTYNIELNDNSLNYERFVTHLRFFFKRLKDRELAEDKDDFLLKQVKNKYKNAYNCMLKIEKYLNVELTDEEKLYLTLHIQRVTQR